MSVKKKLAVTTGLAMLVAGVGGVNTAFADDGLLADPDELSATSAVIAPAGVDNCTYTMVKDTYSVTVAGISCYRSQVRAWIGFYRTDLSNARLEKRFGEWRQDGISTASRSMNTFAGGGGAEERYI